RLDDVRRLVHDDHAAGAEGGLHLTHAVEVHDGVGHVFTAHHRAGSAARNDRKEIVPATPDTAAMALDEFAERQAHGFFEGARLVDVARHHEQLRADVV